MKVIVIGGTGLIGSKLVSKLREHGHDAVPASPNTGVNTITGEGLAEVLKGASVVVDVSNSPSFEETVAMNFFNTATRNLIQYGKAAGVQHYVALSVVGTDRLATPRPSDGEKTIRGYFRAKLAQEKLIQESSIPFSIVHATQFFEFVKSIADTSSDGTTVRVAPVLIQPMAADDVASAVGRVAVGAPVNGIVEVGGPQQFRIDEFVRLGLAAHNDPRKVIADPAAGYFGVEVDDRTLVPGKDARLGETRFEAWLAQSVKQPANASPSSPASASVASR
ncbi:SDR family oxidoreductase [Edaphobacter sp. 12200R-103]|uniref:SDR family oxidoreductase n=1 Tax=Edaphobacter sp. 12200R-103 TaxID=2703788 RepID=UPI00138C393D|nr:NAD(P)H-binding protein [Edaphobacter sp. 12200R-103]QHS53077.1 NAD(P)H-binding protein [Edaphobacter sp. 12200R-103]